MSGRTKPGFDTLVCFWCSINLWLAGILTLTMGTLFNINGAMGVNILGLTIVQMIGIGCFAGAAIFGVVVVHKVIAMLIYLVHHQR